jgi:MFS family permease
MLTLPRLPAFLLPLILINLTGHMALSGGRLTGSLYVLKSGHPEAMVGLFMALFSVIPVMTSLAIGRWVDRAGAVKVLKVGMALVLLGAWLPVVVLSLPTLLLTALIIGFGFNVMSVAAQHTVGHLAPSASSSQRMAHFGWFALGHSSSSTIGPLIAGLLIDQWSFRAAFVAMAVASCVSAWLVATRTRGMPGPIRTGATRSLSSERSRSSPAPEASDGPKLRDEHAAIRKTGVMDLLRSREMRRIYWVNAVTASAWDLFIVMLPVLGHRLGYSASVIGTVFSLFALGTFLARAAMPWLSRHTNEWQILRIALAVICAIFLILPWASQAPFLMVCGLVFGAAVGMSQPNMLSLLHRAAPLGRGGEAVGLRSVLSNTCSVLVPLGFGAALSVFAIAPILLTGALVFASGLFPAHQGARARLS